MVASFHHTGEMDMDMVLAYHAHLVLGKLAKTEKHDEHWKNFQILAIKIFSINPDKISKNDNETCVIWSLVEFWKTTQWLLLPIVNSKLHKTRLLQSFYPRIWTNLHKDKDRVADFH